MERKSVSGSSNVAAISDRDPVTGDFEIEFRGGAAYVHRSVPQELYDGLMAAGSKGSYYFKHLKDRFGVTKL